MSPLSWKPDMDLQRFRCAGETDSVMASEAGSFYTPLECVTPQWKRSPSASDGTERYHERRPRTLKGRLTGRTGSHVLERTEFTSSSRLRAASSCKPRTCSSLSAKGPRGPASSPGGGTRPSVLAEAATEPRLREALVPGHADLFLCGTNTIWRHWAFGFQEPHAGNREISRRWPRRGEFTAFGALLWPLHVFPALCNTHGGGL